MFFPKSVKKGGNRQELHELLRTYSHEAAARVKLEGKPNNLIEKIANEKENAKLLGYIKPCIEGIKKEDKEPPKENKFSKFGM